MARLCMNVRISVIVCFLGCCLWTPVGQFRKFSMCSSLCRRSPPCLILVGMRLFTLPPNGFDSFRRASSACRCARTMPMMKSWILPINLV